MFASSPSNLAPIAAPIAAPFAAPIAAPTPPFYTKWNCLHLSGVEGSLGLRINGNFSVFVILSRLFIILPYLSCHLSHSYF
jgi:hypothetical protein